MSAESLRAALGRLRTAAGRTARSIPHHPRSHAAELANLTTARGNCTTRVPKCLCDGRICNACPEKRSGCSSKGARGMHRLHLRFFGCRSIVYQYAARLHNEPGPGLSHLWLALSLVIWSVSRNSRFSTLDSAWVQSGLAIVPVSMTPSAS